MSAKLELTWYGKEKEISVEPRLLIEHPELSNTAEAPETENMLIHGDNLLALKALESKYAGQVKCIYIVIWSRKHTQRIRRRFDRQCNFTDLRIPVKVKVHVSRPLTGILKSA